jgi:acetyl esterase/lipase
MRFFPALPMALCRAPRWKHGLRMLGLSACLLLAGCEAALFAGLNTTDARHGIEPKRGLVFDAAHGLALDVYEPAKARHAPVVVFFYGGDWARGERGWYRFVGTALAAQGVVVVIPDYRKVPQVMLPGFMEDAARAVAWTHAHAGDIGGDPDDLFVMGHSAGGQIAALLATDPSWLAADGLAPGELAGAIGLAGCYAFVPIPADDRSMLAAFGRTPGEQRRGEPLAHLQGREPPMLLLQGTDDGEVAPANAIAFAHGLRLRQEDVTLRLYPYVGHEALLFALSRPMRHGAPTLDDVMAFIRAHPRAKVRLPSTPPGVASRTGPPQGGPCP